MKKNVAGQKIGAQMTTAADGSEFTSAVTVYVTIDAGTQGAGSVGAGTRRVESLMTAFSLIRCGAQLPASSF